ncbi:CoA-disulfide reductase [Paenibacillus sambharensis]|uniref:CoA-disulfide reductase n=1 Tax=Paenibacillus sambharensis TaxID=1803190 RepID=A0A2W1LNS3_9BACL|nr:CoA-disulfide reductase [Paenibacillus sambharensis]PZD96144.1 CoA-disulfide reductase [Paenibacillus sambharensis]
MKSRRTIVIVGGVAGGASAAARLRRLSEEDEIIMFERGPHISFANCGLPYYIGETITDRDKLLLQTPKAMADRFRIQVNIHSEVTAINRDKKTVTVVNLGTGDRSEQAYDILILSPGAKPLIPDIPGIEEAGGRLFTLRNIPDTDRIKEYVDKHKPQHAAIIGGGFIGIEMAENLRERGVKVTVIERNDQLLTPLDIEMVKPIEQHLRDRGVEALLNESITSITDNGTKLVLQSGRQLDTDLILLAIGVEPESELAAAAGLETGIKGAIKVNRHMQTSDPSIYAVGDAIEVKERVNGTATTVPLAWGANRQGRLAADHINGLNAAYEGAWGTAIIKVFDLTAAVTGSNEKLLHRLGVSYQALHIHPASHAGYYPGASPIAMKVLFDPASGRILGAQAVGMNGVDKRIDVIATAMRGGLLVQDLADLELSYAPPFSSAKDPVNMAGYAASNILSGLVSTMQWHEADDFVRSGGLLIDVRDAAERDFGYIPGSVNIPLNLLRDKLQELPRDREIAVSCQVGQRGYVAARLLAEHGIEARNLDGGYKTYAAGRLNDVPQNHKKDDEAGAEATAASHSPSGQASASEIRLIDACGLQCPGPIMNVNETMKVMEEGERARILATDIGFVSDIRKWASKMGHSVEQVEVDKGRVDVLIRKGSSAAADGAIMIKGDAAAVTRQPVKDGTTMVVFSGDLDKLIASFIIASGAAAMGKPVTMFFTFWGLNALRKTGGPSVKKSGMDRLFGWMMPKGTTRLPLSKMNMGGIGARMIRSVMAKKNVESLESLMQGAVKSGVKLVACTMSMDIMGIKREELIDGLEYAGVASYLSDADDSGINLFV